MDNNNFGNINDPDYVLKMMKDHNKKQDDARAVQKELEKGFDVAVKEAEKEERKRQNTRNNNNISSSVATKTIGNKKAMLVKAKKLPSKKVDYKIFRKKVKTILLAVAITAVIGGATWHIYKDDIKESISTIQDYNESIDILKTKAMFNLLYNGLAGIDSEKGDFVVKNNSTQDYWKLGVTDRNIYDRIDIYIYSLILPSSEFREFIKTVTYHDGLWAYESVEQFLRVNGYFKEETQELSMKEFYIDIENGIKKLSSDVLADYQNADGIYTLGDFIDGYENKGMGGK